MFNGAATSPPPFPPPPVQPLHQQYPMERVLYNLHHKCCTVALHRTSQRSRALAEHFLLAVAVCGFGALLLLHLTFVHRDLDISNSSSSSSARILGHNIPVTCLSSIPGFDKEAAVTHLILLNDDILDATDIELSRKKSRVVRRPYLNNNKNDPTCISDLVNGTETLISLSYDTSATMENNVQQLDGDISFSYSREMGYLLLSSQLSEQHGINAQYVLVSRRDSNCFGEPFLQKLCLQFVGTDTVMINWFLGAFSSSGSDHANGFIYNPRTRIVIDLSKFQPQPSFDSTKNNSSNLQQDTGAFYFLSFLHHSNFFLRIRRLLAKVAIIVKTSFLFFIITTLVSRILHESQGRMLDFTHSLAEHVRTNRPVAPLVATHVAENAVFVPIMVGMIFFLIEFYRGDKLLAFMVLSLVFVCESFSVVSLRTKQGIHFFPRIFFMLFAIFNFYNFSFPFGFSYSALATSMCLMLHSMLFFWHRYELPAVVLGRVSPEHPRQTTYPSSSPISTPQIRSPIESGHSTPGDISPVQFALPMIPRRSIGRSTSFASTNGPLSRASSTGGLFHQGRGDDDESYMFFMGGEVVMHRQSSLETDHQAPSPLPQSMNQLEPRWNNVGASDNSSSHHDTTDSRDQPFAIGLEPLLASGVSTDETEELALHRTDLATNSPVRVPSRHRCTSSCEYSEDDEMSALQAILNASPRAPLPTNDDPVRDQTQQTVMLDTPFTGNT